MPPQVGLANTSMAKSKSAEDRADVPLRPFLSGAAISFGWGAFNVPQTDGLGPLLVFGAEITALSIGSAGVLVILLEIISLVTRWEAVLSKRRRPW